MNAAPGGHPTRSALEREVCAEMERQGVPHEHRSLRFRVQLPSGDRAEYLPDIVARRGPILFLLEHVERQEDPDRMEILAQFLEQHSAEIVLVLVAPAARIRHLPPEAYDEIYAPSDSAAMVRRIREQDPQGMVRPFSKPAPVPSSDGDVRDDG